LLIVNKFINSLSIILRIVSMRGIERGPQTLFIMGKMRPGQLEKLAETLTMIIREGRGEPKLIRFLNDEIGLAISCKPEEEGKVSGLVKRSVESSRILVDRSPQYITLSIEPLEKAVDDVIRCGGSEVILPILFRLGHVYGKELVDTLELSDEKLSERLITTLEYLKISGFFRSFSVLHLSANKIEIALDIDIKTALIHFLRGVLSGIASKIFGRPFTCNSHAKSERVVIFEVVPYR